MRSLLQPLTLGILLGVGVVPSVSADPIRLVDDGRVVAVGAGANNNQVRNTVVNTPSAPFAPFDRAATATATFGGATAETTGTQRSALTPRLFSAFASIESSSTVPAAFDTDGVGISRFSILFDLWTPTGFELTDLMAISPMESSGGVSSINVSLTNEFPNPAVLFFKSIDSGNLQFNRSGTLGAGRHLLFAAVFSQWAAGSEGRSPHNASFDLALKLTPIPEPTSMLLLGSGIVAFASKRVTRAANVRT